MCARVFFFPSLFSNTITTGRLAPIVSKSSWRISFCRCADFRFRANNFPFVRRRGFFFSPGGTLYETFFLAFLLNRSPLFSIKIKTELTTVGVDTLVSGYSSETFFNRIHEYRPSGTFGTFGRTRVLDFTFKVAVPRNDHVHK